MLRQEVAGNVRCNDKLGMPRVSEEFACPTGVDRVVEDARRDIAQDRGVRWAENMDSERRVRWSSCRLTSELTGGQQAGEASR